MVDQSDFVSEVENSSGRWAAAPTWWSYSSLRDAEECPRRWMLRRADYPAIWDRHGYPESPTVPSLIGDVVHRSLETVIDAMAKKGCAAANTTCATDALREMGGFSAVVTAAVDGRLGALAGNPRAELRIADLRDRLRARVPNMRQRLQAVVAKTEMLPTVASVGDQGRVDGRSRLGDGSHPEVELRALDLAWMGRADLITVRGQDCEITDYKTGSRDDSHIAQVRTYALLWFRDVELNPSAALATRLVLRYADGDQLVEPPSRQELSALEDQIGQRSAKASRDLAGRPPEARPSPGTCKGCPVRHLCPEYWASLDSAASETAVSNSQEVTFADMEVRIIRRMGAKSWEVEAVHGAKPGTRVVLRTSTDATVFDADSLIRIVNGAVGEDTESASLILTMTSSTETFRLVRGSQS